MKLRTALTITALTTLMALPFAANAQQGFGQGPQRGGSQSQNNRGGKQTQDTAKGTQGGNRGHGSGSTSGGSQGSGSGTSNRGGQSGSRGNGSGSGTTNRGSGQQDWNGGGQGNRGNGSGSGTNNRGGSQGQDWQNGKNDHKPIQPSKGRGNVNGQDWNRGGNSGQNDWNRNDHRDSRGRTWTDRDDWHGITSSFGFYVNLNLFDRDDTVYFDGVDGSYYPVREYQRDCESRDSLLRARASLFAHTFFYRDGLRFERRMATHNGVRCYQFVRCD